MLDPASIHDLHRAMVPPTIMPPAIERAWQAPAPTGAAVTAFLDAAEAKIEQWRTNLDVWTEAFRRCRNVPRSANELAVLDRMVRETELQTRALHKDVDRRLKRRLRWHKEVASRDAAAGRTFSAQIQRMREMQVIEAETVGRLAVAMRDYLTSVDYRGRAKFNGDERDFLPNAETIAAMQEARAGVGMRRTTSMADLMVELHAEGD